MAKKQDTFYFDTFTACAAHAVKASEILRRCISDYNPDNLGPILDEIHKVEHDADMKKHELINVLAKAFITPIEREDIMLMSQCLDEVVDKLEMLMNHADTMFYRHEGIFYLQGLRFDLDSTGSRSFYSKQYLHQCRLAGTIFS